jgi:hypothetical protein
MQLYSTIDELPFINWVELQKGYLENDVPDVKYMIKKRYLPLRKKHYTGLFENFQNIMEQIPDSDTSLADLWIDYRFEYEKVLSIENINRAANLADIVEKNIDLLPMNRAFKTYIEYIDENYKNFELFVYKLSDNLESDWHYETEIPKELIKNRKLNFVIFEEFINMIKEVPFFVSLILKGELNEFIEKYIDVEVIKVDTIGFIDKRLYELFRDGLNDVPKYRKIRRHFFDYQKLNYEPRYDFDIIEDLYDLIEINNMQYIDYKDKSFTLGDYYRLRKRAKNKAEQIKKQNGKVQSN